jgi:hypothetical protein
VTIKPEPTKEELAKAVYELSVLNGMLLTRIERERIHAASIQLVTAWAYHNMKITEFANWVELPGPIKQASEEGYEEHLKLKYEEHLKLKYD